MVIRPYRAKRKVELHLITDLLSGRTKNSNHMRTLGAVADLQVFLLAASFSTVLQSKVIRETSFFNVTRNLPLYRISSSGEYLKALFACLSSGTRCRRFKPLLSYNVLKALRISVVHISDQCMLVFESVLNIFVGIHLVV